VRAISKQEAEQKIESRISRDRVAIPYRYCWIASSSVAVAIQASGLFSQMAPEKLF
jgi:hypothetical protein